MLTGTGISPDYATATFVSVALSRSPIATSRSRRHRLFPVTARPSARHRRRRLVRFYLLSFRFFVRRLKCLTATRRVSGRSNKITVRLNNDRTRYNNDRRRRRLFPRIRAFVSRPRHPLARDSPRGVLRRRPGRAVNLLVPFCPYVLFCVFFLTFSLFFFIFITASLRTVINRVPYLPYYDDERYA